jgi:hypothetical protein
VHVAHPAFTDEVGAALVAVEVARAGGLEFEASVPARTHLSFNQQYYLYALQQPLVVLQPLLLLARLRVQLRRVHLPRLRTDVPLLLRLPPEHRAQLGRSLVALEELHEGHAVGGRLLEEEKPREGSGQAGGGPQQASG